MSTNKKQEITNRRDYFRLDDRVPISVHLCSDAPSQSDGTAPFFAAELNTEHSSHTTINICAMGINFLSGIPFTEGQVLDIAILFRAFINPVLVKAHILRVNKLESKDSVYQVTVKFIDPASHDVAMIERYIFERQRQLIAEKRIGYL